MAGLNRCLNQQRKMYGLSLGGLIFAGVSFFSGLLFTSSAFIATGIAFIGFLMGSKVCFLWHKGRVQKMIYWYLPLHYLFGKGSIPSYKRYFK